MRQSLAKTAIAGLQWLPAQRWWGAGQDKIPLELDAVAESVDGEALFVGEIKLSLSQNQLHATEKTLERKLAQLPLARGYRQLVAGIFVAQKGTLKAKGSQLFFAEEVLPRLKD